MNQDKLTAGQESALHVEFARKESAPGVAPEMQASGDVNAVTTELFRKATVLREEMTFLIPKGIYIGEKYRAS